MSQITIDTIDEKLAELKLSKEIPDYNGLLSGFSWTREWFASVEEVLLVLAFRGESDQQILEFIRAKIREIDVRSFNKILAAFGAPPIDNHYDYIINKRIDDAQCYKNSNDAIADYIVENISDRASSKIFLSQNTNNKVVDHLVNKRTDLIEWNDLSSNPNDIAVDFLLKNVDQIEYSSLSRNTNDRAISHLLKDGQIWTDIYENCNDVIVDHILKTININYVDYDLLRKNSNDRIVQYLIQNPEKIMWRSFSRNNNDIAVDYILKNIELAVIPSLIINTNIKITQFLINNPNLIHAPLFIRRSDDLAVDYIFKHFADKINTSPLVGIYFNTNVNDRVLEYLMKNPRIIVDRTIVYNKCDYNRPKLREFNKLRLFPRLPHLVL
jgi:hypothetical protein